MNRLLSPEDLHQRIPGRSVIASQQFGMPGLELSCYQYSPWRGSLPPLRDHLLIAFHRSTRIRQRLDGSWRTEDMHLGDCSLLNQSTESEWEWTSPIENTDIHISPVLLSKIAAEVFDRDIQYSLLFNQLQFRDPTIQYIVASLEHEASNAELGGELYTESLINQLCVHLLRKYSKVSFPFPRIRGGLSPLQAKRVTEYIECNLTGALSLHDLANLAKVSPYHFARQFKQRFGYSPHAYVISRRLNRARELLAKKDLMLKEIASCCGFSDQAHMTRLFKRQFNLTPKAARDFSSRQDVS